MPQGLVQVYTGEGKGKTTAASGQLLRALGHGWQVLLVRFLKPREPQSGEVRLLRGLPGLTLLEAGVGVIDGRAEAAEVAASVATTFAEAVRLLKGGEFRMVVFDELNNALHKGYIAWDEMAGFLRQRPSELEVVITGRHAPRELLEMADLVTRMEKVKHPLELGIPAREGVEY